MLLIEYYIYWKFIKIVTFCQILEKFTVIYALDSIDKSALPTGGQRRLGIHIKYEHEIIPDDFHTCIELLLYH